MSLKLVVVSILSAAVILLLMAGRSSIERKLLFYPTHHSENNGLTPWIQNGAIIGYSRTVISPTNVWLMLHGNGGQASDRVYAIPCFSPSDSVFIVEYPGYGTREGVPSKETFNRAAQEAYLFLRASYPQIPVCVVGESIGTGPASSLSSLSPAPDKLVLIVPFDKLSLVAEDHFPSYLVSLILKNNWDNIAALSNYKGALDVFGAANDTVIPVRHAKALVAAVPFSRLLIIKGGHNDWSYPGRVQIFGP
jgi:hypothetical protein